MEGVPGCMTKQILSDVTFVRGAQSIIEDTCGREYIDFHNNGSLSCGHRIEILRNCFSYDYPLNVGRYASVQRDALISLLKSIFPDHGSFQLYSSGTLANEGMLRFASAITRRGGFVGFKGAFHGNTKALASATDVDPWHGDRIEGFHALDFPSEDGKTNTDGMLSRIECELDAIGPDTIAGMIAEPVHTKAMVAPPHGFWRRLSNEVLKPRGILLLADEYMSSGRIGAWLGFSREGVVPDIICVGKAMKTGLPFALLAAQHGYRDLVRNVKGEDSASGQPHICCNVVMTLGRIADEQLLARLPALEQLFKSEMALFDSSTGVVRTYASGALWGIEMNDREVARQVGARCLENGVVLAAIRNCLRMTPAFDIDEDLARSGLALVRNVINEPTTA